ncbi:oligoendopeptidase F [Xylanivirga thermophila]|uniref:oligoendopeptidase F n=1 Tax=Xylanivirga thermophila TaxID=2496273 RepID=UPI00101CB069|nr:oligoendopeptidase F [Xylanivirga thermophila]
MSNNVLPRRDEIDNKFKWKLEDIYSNEGKWEEDYQAAKSAISEIEGYRDRLSSDAHELLEALNHYYETQRILERLFVYARMRKDEDNSNSKYQALSDRAQTLLVEFGSASSYIVPEILTIDEEVLKGWVKEDRGFDVYRQFLNEILREKAHVLSPEEEQILAMAGEVCDAPAQIFSMINDADIKFPHIKDEDGEEVELTKGRYIAFLESKDRRVREDAFRALYDTYGKQRNTLATTFVSNLKKDMFISNTRRYNSSLEAALSGDNVKVEVYDRLIETVEDNLGSMYRYLDLRKRALGLDELHMYDIYVPFVEDVDMKICYEEAKDMVAKALEPLGEKYIEILKEGFDAGWIDTYENIGKTSGAYSWGCYDTHPYVLMSYQDNLNSVFTLAHEMGHAMHSYHSNKNQPYPLAGYRIFVAEVASTLNEILLTHYLLDTIDDRATRAYIINNYLEGFKGTVFRQTMFAEFERIVHGEILAGTPLTCENLCSIYYDLNKKYHGDNIVIDKEIAMEWARIPHFYSSFYVYKYAIGFSAASTLAKGILDGKEGAVDQYIEFLSSGGSDYPVELLKRAGVDVSTPRPIDEAIDMFDKFVDELDLLI